MPNNDTTKQEENNKTELTESGSAEKKEMARQFLETREEATKVKENSLQVIEASNASVSQKLLQEKEAINVYNAKMDEAQRNLTASINAFNGGCEVFETDSEFKQDSSDVVQDDFNTFESYED